MACSSHYSEWGKLAASTHDGTHRTPTAPVLHPYIGHNNTTQALPGSDHNRINHLPNT